MFCDNTACLGTFLVTWHANTGKEYKGKGDDNIDFSIVVIVQIDIFPLRKVTSVQDRPCLWYFEKTKCIIGHFNDIKQLYGKRGNDATVYIFFSSLTNKPFLPLSLWLQGVLSSL